MTDLSSDIGLRKNRQVADAVYRNKALSRAGLSERLFGLLFSGLVYPQIWEDPDVDMEAMQLGEATASSPSARAAATCLPISPGRRPISTSSISTRPHRAEPPEACRLAAICRRMPTCSACSAMQTTAPIRTPSTASSRRISMKQPAATGRAATGAAAGASPPSTAISIGPACSAASSAPAISLHASTASTLPTSWQPGISANSGASSTTNRARSSTARLIRLVLARKTSLFGLGIPPEQYDALATSGDGTMASVLRRGWKSSPATFR